MSIIADLTMPGDRLLTSKEAAAVFRVDPKTVVRWARTGALTAVRTPGGRLLRFWESAVYAALRDGIVEAQGEDATEAVSV
ncbi:helix-turn-helix domain-containing protein [Streptosporangium sp. NPDC050855]|uniref:helix-turn-helix domain-containing protein n=1 Tax=Streptosporangium sp. NPDC050855 TaxID=3366194 RepID=UPI0037931876